MKARKNSAGTNETTLAKTGIAGLDEVLPGGLTAGTLYLVEGAAGTGKTTLGLQFALEGVREGESVLYVTLSETPSDLERVARSHGWESGQGARHGGPGVAGEAHQHLPPFRSGIGGTDDAGERADQAARTGAHRDRLSHRDSLDGRGDVAVPPRDHGPPTVAFLLPLHHPAAGGSHPGRRPPYLCRWRDPVGAVGRRLRGQRRRLWIAKARGREFVGGFHDFIIRKGGMEVFPRLAAPPPCPSRKAEVLPSGIASLDALLGGGATLGSSTLIVGPAGVGESSVAMQFAISAVERGGYAAPFDERSDTMIARATGLHMNVRPLLEEECLRLRQVDPAELSAGQFAHLLRHEVRLDRPCVLVIDSLNGYLQALPDQRFLLAQMHEMLVYSGPMRRRHVPGHGTGGHDWRYLLARQCQLPDGQHPFAAVLRSGRGGTQGDLGGQEARCA